MAACPIIFGLRAAELGAEERAFFATVKPAGFILFAECCVSPGQVAALVGDLKAAVGWPEVPVLIDQEGGRVQRLKPPHWRQAPPAARFGQLAERDLDAARRAAFLNARLLGEELAVLGITVDCAPCLDLGRPETHAVIGDRAFGDAPELVAALGRATCEGLLAAGVQPVIKHLPGHGRATVDSHLDLPRVTAARDELAASDFEPFRRLADASWAMTAHIVYEAIDAARPATVSPRMIEEVIRGDIGFAGLLVSDDLSMEALEGDLGARAAAALSAGCDLALHCSGKLAEMRAVAAAAPTITAAASERLAKALAAAPARPAALDAEGRAALQDELDRLLETDGTARVSG